MDASTLALVVLALASAGAAGSAAALGVLSWRALVAAWERREVRRIIRARLQLIQDGRL